MRVLVIEDEVIIGMLLEHILTAMGHEVIGVEATQAAAVAKAAVVRPELILADENLRAGSGRGAVEQILLGGFIPHIWMSGHPIAEKELPAGVGVLRKPFDEQELVAAMGRVLAPASPPGAA